MTWPVQARSVEGQRSFKIDTSADKKHEYVHIKDVKGWLCKDLELVPPAACKEKAADGYKPAGIRLVSRDNKVTAYIRFSCEECFPLCKVCDMQSLITYLEIPVASMPSLEVDCARVLIDTIMPHLNDVEKAVILAKRSLKKKRIVFGSVIGSEVGGLVDDCLTPDAKAEMIDAAKAYAKAGERSEERR